VKGQGGKGCPGPKRGHVKYNLLPVATAISSTYKRISNTKMWYCH